MKDIKKLIQEEVKKIPISYYAGFAVDLKTSDTCETSYCDVVNREIVISTNQLDQINGDELQAIIENETKLNKVVRGVVYHELSHAILTPSKLLEVINSLGVGGAFSRKSDIPRLFSTLKKNENLNRQQAILKIKNLVNIFEDERIETIFKNAYMNVNFKENIKMIANYERAINPDKLDALNEFFNVVRFGRFSNLVYRKSSHNSSNYRLIKHLEKYTERILTRTAFNKITSFELNNFEFLSRYLYIILDFYIEVYDFIESLKQVQENDQEENQENDQEEQEESQETSKSKTSGSETSESETSESNAHGSNEAFESFKKLLANTFKANDSTLIEKDLEPILKKHNKEGLSSGGSYGYNGRIDPRILARKQTNPVQDDYKWFSRPIGDNSKNKRELQLNVYLDNSGSYKANENTTRSIIKALFNMSKKGLFKVRIFTINYRVNEIFNSAYFQTYGGTCISNEDIVFIRKTMQPQANTDILNILMLDGGIDQDAIFWKMFNDSNSYIIYEQENKNEVEEICTKANKIFVNQNDFSSKLISSFLTAIDKYLK